MHYELHCNNTIDLEGTHPQAVHDRPGGCAYMLSKYECGFRKHDRPGGCACMLSKYECALRKHDGPGGRACMPGKYECALRKHDSPGGCASPGHTRTGECFALADLKSTPEESANTNTIGGAIPRARASPGKVSAEKTLKQTLIQWQNPKARDYLGFYFLSPILRKP